LPSVGFRNLVSHRNNHENIYQDNVSERDGLLYQWTSTIQIKLYSGGTKSFTSLSVLVCDKHEQLTTDARGTDHPPFSNFLFTNLFSIKFLYFFIISSLFPYFNLFVSIFIQSYANIKLHVSTLLDTNNTQGMQLGRFKNRTPVRFEYIYCTLFPLCHSN
jgi:hypothetical protein